MSLILRCKTFRYCTHPEAMTMSAPNLALGGLLHAGTGMGPHSRPRELSACATLPQLAMSVSILAG